MNYVRTFCIALMIVLFSAVFAHAQDATVDITLSTMPLDPQPLQQVTITAESYSTDLTQDNLAWTYNGQNVASSIGRTSITVTAPASGMNGTVIVTVSGNGVTPTTATLSLRPASVDLLWEGADSYTPPFYKGRALPSKSGIIRVVAIPSITSPKQLSYSWSENGTVLQASSGYGKSSILLQNNTLTPVEQIAVTEKNGGFSGSDNISITPGMPSVVGYFNNDGYIDYANGSTTGLSTSDTGSIIHFEPYFFSAPISMSHDLSFSYTDNQGNTIPQGDSINELRLSRPDSGGQSFFTVAISTVAYSLQNISHQFFVNFSNIRDTLVL